MTCNMNLPVIDSIFVQSATCNSNNAELVIFARGTGTLEYSIDNTTSFQSSNMFPALVRGDYLVRVRDDIGLNDPRFTQIPNLDILM